MVASYRELAKKARGLDFNDSLRCRNAWADLTNDEQQRLGKIVTDSEKLLRAAQSVQTMRDLWEELQSIALTCTKEEAADFMLRWTEAMREAYQCEQSPKQIKEIVSLVENINELGNAPLRPDFDE